MMFQVKTTVLVCSEMLEDRGLENQQLPHKAKMLERTESFDCGREESWVMVVPARAATSQQQPTPTMMQERRPHTRALPRLDKDRSMYHYCCDVSHASNAIFVCHRSPITNDRRSFSFEGVGC